MITLRHAIKIAASRSHAFHALTDIGEMAAWHLGTVKGAIAPGETLVLTPKLGTRFSWRTESVEPDRRIIQTCIEGSGSSPGRTLTFNLADGADGRTLVELTDGEWQSDDPHLPFCNTHWGEVLHRLKGHVERDAG